MAGVRNKNVVKRSVSFSPLVNQWAEEMAQARGYGNNFSAFLADLIREAQERAAKSKPVVYEVRPAADLFNETPPRKRK